jgi:predicted hydrocarbon binding protein
MYAEDLQMSDIISFSEGNLNLKGRRLVLHDLHALAEMRNDLFDMVGYDNTRRLLTRFGYYWGKIDAATLRRIFSWENTEEWLKAGPRKHSIQGVVKVATRQLQIDEVAKRFYMEVLWHNSEESEQHLLAAGTSVAPICWTLVGYASGYASYCLGFDVYFIEKECATQGYSDCLCIGRDKASWGNEINSHLSYYNVEDIQGKIETLSVELARKMSVVQEQQKEIETLTNTFFVEVRSKAFGNVLDLAQRIAPYDSSVLITGETGVGKEVLGRYIHSLSSRAKSRFFAINCGALPETLLESELFGYKSGSFTGAVRDRAGRIGKRSTMDGDYLFDHHHGF